MTGTVLGGRYRIEDQLGEGGMGVVYRAYDTLLQRRVAVKTVAPVRFGEDGSRRIVREAQAVAKLNHPNIVSIYDAVEEGGTFAIVMELVEGQPLRTLLPMPVVRLLEITPQILRALDYAHGQGVVHRDIKPENIIVTTDGTAKLMDFGLARSEGRSRLTQTGMVVGTVAYLAPEQALGGQVDARSDLYSLGAVLYEAVAGRPPFESDDPISVITQHINVPPVAPHWHNPEVSEAFERVILKLLAKDPARRYQTAGEVLAALDALGGLSTPSTTALEKVAGPELVERIQHSPLVGRETEVARLKELVDRTVIGRGGVVLVSGPLGVGKTRLIDEMATYARLRGVSVVSGKAYESAPPYEPVAHALRELTRGLETQALSAALGEFAHEVVGLVPEMRNRLPAIPEPGAGSGEERKNRLFAGVAHFLGSMAARTPILLALDDMHLSDQATVELLQHLARRTEASRILLVAAYRPDEVQATPAGRLLGQVIHALSREAFCTTMTLRPLNEDQVIDLIRLMANHQTRPVRFGRRIFEVTEGNPYFVEEVIKGLFAQGLLYIKDGQWSTDFDDVRDYSMLEIPSSVHAAVEARLRALDDETRQALTVAAVIGRQFSFDVLLDVTARDEATLLNQVEHASRTQLIREVRGAGEDVYEFAQPMLRQVLYDSVPRRRRRLLHRQVGEALEKAKGRKPDLFVESLAVHFAEAEEPEKTMRYARAAAQKAAALFAYDSAAHYLQEALAAAEDLDRPTEGVALLDELADVQFAAGPVRRNECIRTYEDAVQLWKSLPRAPTGDGVRLYRKLGELARWGWYNPRTGEHILEGLRLLSDAPTSPERVKLLIAQAFNYYWLRGEVGSDYAAAEASAREAYRLAEAMGSEADMSAALDALAGIYWQTADFARMRSVTEERGPIVARLQDGLTEITDYYAMLGRSLALLGEFAQAVQWHEQAYDLAAKATSFLGLHHTTVELAATNTAWNRWADAERWIARYVEVERRVGYPSPLRRRILTARAAIAGARGNTQRAVEDLRALENEPAIQPALAWTVPYGRLIPALLVTDQTHCQALLDEALRLADTPIAKLDVQTLALQFAARFGQWRYADELGDDTLARARGSQGRWYIAQACLALGAQRREHGRLDEADALIGEAVDTFRALDCPWDLGKALRETALLRIQEGRREEAHTLLTDALRRFETLGALPDVERTKALL